MRLTKTEMVTMLSFGIPYILIFFFLRHTNIFVFYGLLGFSGLFILGSLIILLLTKPTKFKKIYYFLAAAFSITIFTTFTNTLVDSADKIFYLIHKGKMQETVLQIEKAQLENKPIVFPELNFAKVDTLESGEVIFTLDGMLDNCVGIAYSKDNENPGYTNCGRIIEWKKLDDHWYLWYTT